MNWRVVFCVVCILVISICYICVYWYLAVSGITFAKMQKQNC